MSTFTPEQIQEILDIYFENFAHRQYIGARYVPIFGRKNEDSIEWDNTGTYEPLTIVLYQGNSFTSRQFVPVGVDITNEAYWALTGNYNAQVEAYRQEVAQYTDTVGSKAFGFSNVDEMSKSDVLSNGAICHTDNFANENDNGGAWYSIKINQTPNGMDVIECKNGLYAVLITEGSIKPEQLGADGTNTNDCSDIFNYMVSRYDNIELQGNYFIHKDVEISNIPIRMYSNNRASVTFDHASFVQTIEFCRYENIRFSSHSGEMDSELTLFKIITQSTNNDTWFNFCWFSRAGICIDNTGVNLHLENCNAGDCGTVIKNNYDANIGNQNRAIIMKNCKVQGAALVADFDSEFPNDKARAANHFASNHFDYCGKIINGNVPNLLFVDNYIYVPSAVPFITLSCNNFNFQNVTCEISNNTFVNGAPAFNDFLFSFDATNNITFKDNYIRASSLNLLEFKTSNSGLVIDGNVFWNNANAVIDVAAAIGTIFINNIFRNSVNADIKGIVYSIEGNTNVNYSNLYLSDFTNILIASNLQVGETITPNVAKFKKGLYIAKLTVTQVDQTTYTDHVFLIPYGATSMHSLGASARGNNVSALITFTFSQQYATLTVNAFTFTGTNVDSFTIDELIAL